MTPVQFKILMDINEEFLAAKVSLLEAIEKYLTAQFKNPMYNQDDKNEIINISTSLNILRAELSNWSTKIRTSNTLLAKPTDKFFFDLLDKVYNLVLMSKEYRDIRASEPGIWNRLMGHTFLDLSSLAFIAELPAQVSKYIRVGAEMYNSCEILEIKEAIQTLQFTDNINLPSLYAAIVGPSFMGKTQSAFTLAHIMNVFYVNFASILANDLPQQEIYSPFEKISSIFESCLDFDRPRTIKTKNTAKSIQRSSKSYRTLGLLTLLIQIDWPDSLDEKFLQYINLNNLIVPSMTITEFNNMIQGTVASFILYIHYSLNL